MIGAVSKALLQQCKTSKLVAFEIPQKIAIVADPWTPENDLLTAQLKLKRPAIVRAHQVPRVAALALLELPACASRERLERGMCLAKLSIQPMIYSTHPP